MTHYIEITKSLTRTINLGDFSNIKHTITGKASVASMTMTEFQAAGNALLSELEDQMSEWVKSVQGGE